MKTGLPIASGCRWVATSGAGGGCQFGFDFGPDLSGRELRRKWLQTLFGWFDRLRSASERVCRYASTSARFSKIWIAHLRSWLSISCRPCVESSAFIRTW
jgi:hypothetical protein